MRSRTYLGKLHWCPYVEILKWQIKASNNVQMNFFFTSAYFHLFHTFLSVHLIKIISLGSFVIFQFFIYIIITIVPLSIIHTAEWLSVSGSDNLDFFDSIHISLFTMYISLFSFWKGSTCRNKIIVSYLVVCWNSARVAQWNPIVLDFLALTFYRS
jgi:hypothetical protein